MQGRSASHGPLFITGMARSGTTLIRSMLCAHSRITISPETHFLGLWVNRDPYRKLDLARIKDFWAFWEAFIGSERFSHLGISEEAARNRISTKGPACYRTVFESILEEYAVSLGKQRWGEKTPGHHYYIDTFFDWFPDARVIFMIRDPRAVAASWIKAWGPTSVDWIAWEWCKAIRHVEDKLPDRRIIVQQYESLVVKPETELRRLCEAIDEKFEQSMIDERSVSDMPIINRGGWAKSYLHAVVQKPVFTASIEKWRNDLSFYQIRVIEYIANRQMKDYGYDTITRRLPIYDGLRWRLKNKLRSTCRKGIALWNMSK